MYPPKSGQPLYSGQITWPDWFYHRANTFWTFEKQTPLNFEQQTLMSPRHTLAMQNYFCKWTVKQHPLIVLYIMRTLVDSFCKIVRHHRWIQKTGHCISTVAYRASLSHHGTATDRSENAISSCSTAQAHITTPTGSIPNAHNGYLRILQMHSCTFANEQLHTNNNRVFILLLLS